MPAAHRGEIGLIDLGLAAKTRTALVFSVEPLPHERALVTYVPRTSSLRRTRFEVAHLGRGFDPGDFTRKVLAACPTRSSCAGSV